MKCNQKCNPVYNFQQNGVSRKMLMAKMIQNGKSINYANSQTTTLYKTILSLDYVENKKLLLLLKYKIYTRYLNHLITCSKHNSHAIIKMKEEITYIKQYLKTFNDRRLREEYSLYTSLKKPTILENYFKDFIKNELDTRGIGI